jgi:hypothetical protein
MSRGAPIAARHTEAAKDARYAFRSRSLSPSLWIDIAPFREIAEDRFVRRSNGFGMQNH